MVSVVWSVVLCVWCDVEFSLASENRSRTTRSRFLHSVAVPDENCSTPAIMKKQTKEISH